MAEFYASIQGSRGPATRMGSKSSGISGHIRGWNVGVAVEGRVNEDGEIEFDVYATGGSNGYGPRRLMGVVYQDADTGEPRVGTRLVSGS